MVITGEKSAYRKLGRGFKDDVLLLTVLFAGRELFLNRLIPRF
jgi:hypothetical protein